MNSKLVKIVTYLMYALIFIFSSLSVLVLIDGFRNSGKPEVPVSSEIIKPVEMKKVPIVSSKPIIIDNVPFTPQAPFGNWGNITYEEGCEEASMLMAIYWVRGESLTPELANEQIKKISDYETKILGTFLDTSVSDTARVMKEYFSFNKYKIMENITKNSIIESLRNGNMVLAPAYGRDLKNVNYTPPGPVAHMLVIIGYDPQTKEFITNDSGTKSGKGYRYNEDILYDAIWAYPTSKGNLLPPTAGEKRNKTVIEIFKK